MQEVQEVAPGEAVGRRRTRPRGPSSPLRCGDAGARASGGAVPSRWTCSSALGTSRVIATSSSGGLLRPARVADADRGAQRVGGRARRAPSSRAWTTASGRSRADLARRARATSVRPTAWSMASSSRRRPPPSSMTTRPTARHVDARRRRRRARARPRRVTGAARQVVVGALEQVGRAAERGAPCARSARPRRRSRARLPARGRVRRAPAQARAAARASASVTSSRRGSRAAPVRWSIDSRTSTRVAGGAAEHLVHVGEQRDGRQAGAARRPRRSRCASSRALVARRA